MRRLLAVITSLLLIALPLAAAPRLTNAQLQGWFDYYNKTLFGGKLPPTVVKWSDLTLQDDMASTLCITATDGMHCSIAIDRATNPTPRTTQMTLVHETCHVYVDSTGGEFDQHGKRFKTCMLERAMEGTLADIW